MKKDKVKFLYLSPIDAESAIFHTQVIEWLQLFKEHSVSFSLIRLFHFREVFKISYIKKQINVSKTKYDDYVGFTFLLPSKPILNFLNAFIIAAVILKNSRKHNKVVVFTRYGFGPVIFLLKKITPKKVIFYYDARGAGAEERKYSEILKENFSLKSYKTTARAYYSNYQSLKNADKVFVVSNFLKEYFIKTFGVREKKFVLYPCLSDSSRFFYDKTVRETTRKELGIDSEKKVFIYAGGTSKWHMAEKIFEFFNLLQNNIENSYFLFLTKNTKDIESYLVKYPKLKPNISYLNVDNTEIFKYYNAADYGLLLRHNTIMNNVSSPTKYAEYILCGLPVIISEGVGDYSSTTVVNNLGLQISESELLNLSSFDFDKISNAEFDRNTIADYGRKFLSKDSIISSMVKELNETDNSI